MKAITHMRSIKKNRILFNIFLFFASILYTMHLNAQTVLLNEGFEGGNLPAGWSQVYEIGTWDWSYQNGGDGTPGSAHTGSYNAFLHYNGIRKTKLVTKVIDFGSYLDNTELTFWHTQGSSWFPDELRIYYKTSAGGSWNKIATYTQIINSWTKRTISLPNPNSTYYIAFEGYTNSNGYGVCIDDVKVTGEYVNPMVFVSCTATQNNTASVDQGSVNQEIIGLQVVTTGTNNPLSVTEFRIRTDGTTDYTNDITNMRIWYSGTSSTFATGTQFGTGTTPQAPGTNTVISGSQTLATGTNYFWVTYDITAGATAGNVVDAVFQNVDVGGLQTPTTTTPAGNRSIVGAPPMTYTSSTVAQASTNNVYPGNTNQEILRVSIVTTGTLNPLAISSFRLQTDGSSAPTMDLTNTKIFYTGTSSTFSTASQFGTTYNSPPAAGTNYNITGNQTLAEGTNYFWVTYDLAPGATAGNVVDGICNQVTIDGSIYTPTTTDPAGNRLIESSSPPMIYTSSTVSQASTDNVYPGDTNQEIIRVSVVTTESYNPLAITSFRLRAAGSSAPTTDITNAKIYYTGTSSTFSTASQFGNTYNNPTTTNYYITGNQTLAEGTNYFWVTYDIAAGATIGHVVDGRCNEVTVGGSTYTPTTTNPAGNRPIGGNAIFTCNYTWYDSGGAGENYSNNEADTVTFCSTNGESIQVTFTSFNTVASEDELYVYDGPDVFSNLLMVLSGQYLCQVTPFTYIPPRVNSTNECITFKFVSSGSNTKPGWEAEVECAPFCGNNKMAKDNCGSATAICDLNGYCGNTSGIYTTDKPGNMCDMDDGGCSLFTGRIHNNSWLQFRAKTSNVTIYVDVYDCNLSNGIQFGVYEGDGCNNFVLVSDPDYVSGGANMPANTVTELNITGLTPGQTYYIMVDGNTGDVCNYSITSDDFLTPDAGDDVAICQGDSVQMNAEGGLNYTWTPASTLSNANIANPIAFPTETTSYVVEFTGTECLVTDTVTVVVYDNPQSGITATPDSVCIGGSSQLYGNPTPGTGTITSHLWTGPASGDLDQTNIVDPVFTATTGGLNTLIYTVTDEYGCSTTSQININVFEITTDFEIDSVLCPDDPAIITYTGIASALGTYNWDFPGGTPSSATGIGPHTVYFPPGGDYTVTLNSVDDYGCTSIGPTSQVVHIPDPLYGVITGTDVLCYGDATGSADLEAYGGTPDYTYTWSNGATTQDISGLSIGVYSVIIEDDHGCQKNTSVTISQPTSVLYAQNPTLVYPLCNGDSNGEITVNPAGGTSPYTYNWNTIPPQTTNPATGLSVSGGPGYTVTITDDHGCTYADTYTLIEPTEIILVTSYNNATCNQSNGFASVSPSGGAGSFSYLWNTGATGSSIINVPFGTYSVTVTDNNGCTEIASVIIDDEGAPTASIDTTIHVTCYGISDGAMTVVASAGSPPYSYTWFPNVSTDASASNLTAGVYFVTVSDQLGCNKVVSDTIEQPPALITNIVGTDVPCNDGSSTGSADLSVYYGTPPYYFEWNSGESTEDISGLTTGEYIVTVTDENGCIKLDSVTISVPDALLSDIVQDSVVCYGQNNGSADLTVTGGTQPISYHWSGGQISQDIYNQFAGTYYVTITDGNGCEITDSITIYQPQPFAATIIGSDLLCYNDNTGALNLIVAGGTQPYSYLWNPGGYTTQDISNLPAGFYSAAITDANGCGTGASDIIMQPSPLTYDLFPDNADCNGENSGSVNIDVLGGTVPYTYIWSNGSTEEDIVDIGASAYTVTITDANGCDTTATTTISEPSAIITEVTGSTDALCYGGADGTATVTATGGSLPYTYNIGTGPQVLGNFSGLSASTYIVTITDANSCTSEPDPVTIGQPTQILITFVDTMGAYCGNNSGWAAVTASGGTPDYQYKWNDAQSQANDTATNLLGNMYYTVSVTDAHGCMEIMDSIWVSNYPGGSAEITQSENVTCYSDDDGSATVGMIGGTAPYSYYWSNGQTTSTASGLSGNVYFVTVTDINGCTATTNINISEPDLLEAEILAIDIVNILCYGNSTGSAEVSVTGGIQPYTYIWSSGGTNALEENLHAGNYVVSVTDDNGCPATAAVTVLQPDSALIIMKDTVSFVCYGKTDGYAEVYVIGGTIGNGYTYLWEGGETDNFIEDMPPDSYTVTATDANGCTATKTVTITEAPEITYQFDTISTSCNGASDGEIILAADVVNPPYNYVWSNIETSPHITDLAPGYYTVTITDGDGCTTAVTFEVPNSPLPCLVIPNVITPNNDGFNDTWNIAYLKLYKNITIQVYNRWGEIVYEFEGDGEDYEFDTDKQWDGTSSSNGKPLPLGSYIYIIQFNNNDEMESLQGIVTIVRKVE